MSTPAKTKTGGFPIGIRMTGEFDKLAPAALAAWATRNGFGCIDVGISRLADVAAFQQGGLPVGTLDLFGREWTGMLSADAGKRKATVELARKTIRAGVAAGTKLFFVVMLAEDVSLPRKETFRYMVETYGQLRGLLQETGSRMSIEGWPGCNAQCCTPESYRAFLQEMNSPAYGINYDPSHLLRMGIDPLRFVQEFAPHVVHVHGKDTSIDAERLYNLGTEQAPVFAGNQSWGGPFWRYTIPGDGVAPWKKIFTTLKAAKFSGYVSIELEDANYNGTLAGEKKGFLAARKFLQSV